VEERLRRVLADLARVLLIDRLRRVAPRLQQHHAAGLGEKWRKKRKRKYPEEKAPFHEEKYNRSRVRIRTRHRRVYVLSMNRREPLVVIAGSLARGAGRLPANRNVKWGLGSNLWNSFPRVPFTDILDVMKDTGFIGLRLTQFPQILKTYNITAAQMQKEASKRGCSIVTISFNGPAHDPARRSEIIAN